MKVIDQDQRVIAHVNPANTHTAAAKGRRVWKKVLFFLFLEKSADFKVKHAEEGEENVDVDLHGHEPLGDWGQLWETNITATEIHTRLITHKHDLTHTLTQLTLESKDWC